MFVPPKILLHVVLAQRIGRVIGQTRHERHVARAAADLLLARLLDHGHERLLLLADRPADRRHQTLRRAERQLGVEVTQRVVGDGDLDALLLGLRDRRRFRDPVERPHPEGLVLAGRDRVLHLCDLRLRVVVGVEHRERDPELLRLDLRGLVRRDAVRARVVIELGDVDRLGRRCGVRHAHAGDRRDAQRQGHTP